MNAAADLPKVGDRFEPRPFGPFGLDVLSRYAAVSGDDNPLHLDPEVARLAGLASPPIHGMLMMSCFEPAVAAWRPDLFISRLSAKFLRPVLAGESIDVSGRVVQSGGENPKVVLRLMAYNARRDLAILGEATLIPYPPTGP